MKKISLFIMAILTFAGCSKIEVNKENILGTWVDDYSAYPYYAPEGGETYTFNADGTVDIHYYDVFAGDHDVQRTYTVGAIEGTSGMENNVLLLDPHMSDYSGDGFKIVKLTKTEMEWQRLGTTFQKGTVGSDFKHFVRK
ncbi:MAG: hypothetical protein KIG56_08605 [Bacteroidales bacterium]|nr:hypothetical protein [Bacteroidales bacterium]